MRISKAIKIAAAGALAALMGSGTAVAQIAYEGETNGVHSYSNRSIVPKETVIATGSRRGEGGPFYRITVNNSGTGNTRGDSNWLRTFFPVTLVKPANGVTLVRFTLQGMVFAEQVVAGDLLYFQSDRSTPYSGVSTQIGSGGGAGTNEVIFRLSGATGLGLTDYYRLNLSVSVSEGGGSIMMANRLATDGLAYTSPTAIPAAITFEETIKDDASGKPAVADVNTGFMRFDGDDAGATGPSRASLGSITLGTVTPGMGKRNIRQDTTVAGFSGAGGTATRADLAATEVAFSGGDISFASKVYLSEMSDCTPNATTDIQLLTEGEDGEMEWITTGLPRPGTGTRDFRGDTAASVYEAVTRHLCIEVDGETEMKETPAFVATIRNQPNPGAVFPPRGTDVRTLGSITRSGATYRIPFISGSDGYNHRLVMTNHTGNEVSYDVSFTTESDDVTATPGGGAEGTLPPNSRTVIRSADLVSFEGSPPRAAAVVDVQTNWKNVTVSTVLINRMDGSSDTVMYRSEEESMAAAEGDHSGS